MDLVSINYQFIGLIISMPTTKMLSLKILYLITFTLQVSQVQPNQISNVNWRSIRQNDHITLHAGDIFGIKKLLLQAIGDWSIHIGVAFKNSGVALLPLIFYIP